MVIIENELKTPQFFNISPQQADLERKVELPVNTKGQCIINCLQILTKVKACHIYYVKYPSLISSKAEYLLQRPVPYWRGGSRGLLPPAQILRGDIFRNNIRLVPSFRPDSKIFWKAEQNVKSMSLIANWRLCSCQGSEVSVLNFQLYFEWLKTKSTLNTCFYRSTLFSCTIMSLGCVSEGRGRLQQNFHRANCRLGTAMETPFLFFLGGGCFFRKKSKNSLIMHTNFKANYLEHTDDA